MPKIEKFCVKNFQSWKEVTIDLHEGVNVLIGSSDEGKSALIRALRWALLNKVKGDFINWDTTKKELAEVKIHLDNGVWFARQKNLSGSINQYLIKDFKDPLTALKHDLPKEIKDITGISEFNIQRQKKWFLLEDKPSEVANKFNKITGLDIIDDVIKVANSEIRKTVSIREFEEDGLSKLKDQLEELDWVDEMVESFQELKLLYNSVNKVKSKIERLRRSIELHDTIHQKIKRIEPALNLKAELSNLISDNNDIDDLKKQAMKLNYIVEKYKSTKQQIKKNKTTVKFLSEIKLYLDEYKEIQNLMSEFEGLSELIGSYKTLYDRVEELQEYSKKAKSLFDKTLQKLGKCPTCGRTI